MGRYWCGVVSKEHIMRGIASGFCQVCHGKRAPIARMSKGDGIVFYSPVIKFQGDEKCQKFTAIGRVIDDHPYQFQMTQDFTPFRRNIEYYIDTIDAPIHPMLKKLSFTCDIKSWGYPFRRGHFEITASDFQLVAQSMMPESWHKACIDINEQNCNSKVANDLFNSN